MKKLTLAFLFAIVSTTAGAQNTTCATRPVGDTSNACASTAFVRNIGNLPIIAANSILGNNTGSPAVPTALNSGLGVISAIANDTNSINGFVVNPYTSTNTANPTSQTYAAKLDKVVLATDDSGVDPTGATDSAAGINRLIASGGVGLKFPCGTYLISAVIAAPNNTDIDGQNCATIKLSASLSIDPMWALIPGSSGSGKTGIANKLVAGNSNISVRNITVDGTLAPSNTHLIRFYKGSGINVSGVKCVGPGTDNVQDCIAMVQTDGYSVRNNSCVGIRNACYDQWDGSSNGVISGNTVTGGGVLSYGILINGIATDYSVNTTKKIVVSGNIVNDVKSVGIWVGGLYNAGTGTFGVVNDVVVTGNLVDTSNLHGILVSDGNRNIVNGNVIRNTAADGVRVGSQSTGTTDTTTVSNNIVDNSNTSSGSYSAFHATALASRTIFSGNQVLGSLHQYAVSASAGTTYTNIVNCGPMAAGIFGTIGDGGTGGTRDCYDGSSLIITSPGSVKLGIAGADGQFNIDTGGNVTIPASTRNMGSATYAWAKLYAKAFYMKVDAPALSSCGTSPSIDSASSNNAGRFTTGAGATACTVTFATAYSYNSYCTITSKAAPAGVSEIPYISAQSGSAFTVSGLVASRSYTYTCFGN